MAIIANPTKPNRYVLRRDVGLDKAEQTAFFYLPMLVHEMDSLMTPSEHPLSDIAGLCAGKIVGWENLRDLEGRALDFSTDMVSKLPLDILTELAKQITGSAKLEASDAGN